MTLQDALREGVGAAASSTEWSVSPEVFRELMRRLGVKGYNAKARRRWRRRNLPNTQREADRAAVAAEFQRWHAALYGAEEAKL